MFQLIFTDCQFCLKYEEIFWSYPWFGVLLELSLVWCTFGVILGLVYFWSYPWFGVLLELSLVWCTFGVILGLVYFWSYAALSYWLVSESSKVIFE